MQIYIIFFCLFVCLTNGNKTSEALYEEDSLSDNPKIFYLHSLTNITNRYATTLVTCKIKNPSVVSKEATFSLVLPEKAFISDFIMEINNKSYQAYVKEKEEAQKIYDTAVQKGQGAAQVKVSTRNSKRFIVSVNLEPEEKASFYLKYEELLEKNQDQYEVVMNVHPGQLVKNLNIEMIIQENQGFKYVNPAKMRRGNKAFSKTIDANAKITDLGKTKRMVSFSPDEDEQQEIATKMESKRDEGISGQFIVTYDVGEKPEGGFILQTRGYFAHFYAPTEKTVLPKYIIFILDTSGSMYGLKLDHMKRAMNNVLSILKPEDLFNIVEFNSFTKVWDMSSGLASYKEGKDDFLEEYSDEDEMEDNILPPAQEANTTTIEKAKSIIDLFQSIGGTDIDTAFKVGFKVLNQNFPTHGQYQPIIMFLTDGEATNGELDYNKILKSVSDLNKNRASIYTLSLGAEANREFLKKISLKNKGKSGHIYEDDDIYAQFENFFKKISEPVLSNVTFDYGSDVSEVTNHRFNNLFRGSEVVISGKKSNNLDFSQYGPGVTGQSSHGQIMAKPTVENVERADLKRLWAYLRVKQLLDLRKIAENKTILTKKALNLALKYSFVTEITSLVVVKPSETKVVGLEDASVGSKIPTYTGGGHSYSASYGGNNNNDGFKNSFGWGSAHHQGYGGYSSHSGWENVSHGNLTDSELEIQLILKTLPWLGPLINLNGTISTPNGIIQFDLSPVPFDAPSFPKCEVQLNSTLKEGQCKNLSGCSQLHYKIFSLEDLRKYSCKQNEKYTGLCCIDLFDY